MRVVASLALFASFALGGSPPDRKVVHLDGRIAVVEQKVYSGGAAPAADLPLGHTLLIGGIDRGNNFLKPDDKQAFGDPKQDFSRLATTYYHPASPVGRVMELYNWFPGEKNTYASDARMAATIIGLGATPASFGIVPDCQLTAVWSEAPYAVLSMYAGTMASYARPFQVVDFYERNPKVVELSLPANEKPYFQYIRDAKNRGAEIRVIPGKERNSLAKLGPRKFYHVLVVEICPRTRLEDLAVDLLTKDGMQTLLDSLADDGILCYHISNQFVNAEPVLADVAKSLNCVAWQARDMAAGISPGAYTSQWVVVARRLDAFRRQGLNGKVKEVLQPPSGYEQAVKEFYKKNYGYEIPVDLYWSPAISKSLPLWTDASRHPIKGLLYGDPTVARTEALINMAAKVVEKLVYWKELTGSQQPLRANLGGLRQMAAELRAACDLTIEDLQKGYPDE